MQVAIDISLYPLTPDYELPIIRFIQQLNSNPELSVITNELSTQVIGEYDTAMAAVQSAMKATFMEGPVASFVLKVLNVGIEGGKTLHF